MCQHRQHRDEKWAGAPNTVTLWAEWDVVITGPTLYQTICPHFQIYHHHIILWECHISEWNNGSSHVPVVPPLPHPHLPAKQPFSCRNLSQLSWHELSWCAEAQHDSVCCIWRHFWQLLCEEHSLLATCGSGLRRQWENSLLLWGMMRECCGASVPEGRRQCFRTGIGCWLPNGVGWARMVLLPWASSLALAAASVVSHGRSVEELEQVSHQSVKIRTAVMTGGWLWTDRAWYNKWMLPT